MLIGFLLLLLTGAREDNDSTKLPAKFDKDKACDAERYKAKSCKAKVRKGKNTNPKKRESRGMQKLSCTLLKLDLLKLHVLKLNVKPLSSSLAGIMRCRAHWAKP